MKLKCNNRCIKKIMIHNTEITDIMIPVYIFCSSILTEFSRLKITILNQISIDFKYQVITNMDNFKQRGIFKIEYIKCIKKKKKENQNSSGQYNKVFFFFFLS